VHVWFIAKSSPFALRQFALSHHLKRSDFFSAASAVLAKENSQAAPANRTTSRPFNRIRHKWSSETGQAKTPLKIADFSG
jgi:hypothetical protein